MPSPLTVVAVCVPATVQPSAAHAAALALELQLFSARATKKTMVLALHYAVVLWLLKYEINPRRRKQRVCGHWCIEVSCIHNCFCPTTYVSGKRKQPQANGTARAVAGWLKCYRRGKKRPDNTIHTCAACTIVCVVARVASADVAPSAVYGCVRRVAAC